MKLRNAWFRFSRQCKSMLVSAIPKSMVLPLADTALRARNRLLERGRQIDARRNPDALPLIESADRLPLRRSILEPHEAWNQTPIPDCTTPGMLTDAEKRYYQFIAKFVSGEGAAVEVGTWLGMSTFYLASALQKNPNFKAPLRCYDDFIWRSSSMDKWVAGMDVEKPGNYESFQPLFQKYLEIANIDQSVVGTRAKVGDYPGNEDVDMLHWDHGPIEMCVVDCGRTLAVNEGWYGILSPSFIPNRTLVVMQDWQNHKAVPERWWENTRIFTEGKGDALEMIHEVRNAGIATFLYRG